MKRLNFTSCQIISKWYGKRPQKQLPIYFFEIAAGYAFHVAEPQSFLDGNKRTAIASALVFLGINGIDATVIESPMNLYAPMIEIADGKMSRSQLAEILRKEMTTK